MSTTPQRHIRIAGTYNIRDLGGYPTASGSTTQWRRILRADSLHRLDADGVDALRAEGLRVVIDLRHPRELNEAPNPFRHHPNVAYLNVSLFENLAPGPEMAARHGGSLLLGLYIAALTERGPALRQVLSAIADAPPGAVLFHCTAGKDRTGLVAALILAAAGVPDDVILADYAETGRLIAPMLDELIAGAAERGVDIEGFKPLLTSHPETMAGALAHIASKHRSIAAYLDSIDFTTDRQNALIARLTRPDVIEEVA